MKSLPQTLKIPLSLKPNVADLKYFDFEISKVLHHHFKLQTNVD